MKFGQKIFLVSFILIIIAMNGIGIVMINHTYKANIQKEIEKNMIQINSIMTEINAEMNSLAYIANVYWKNDVNIKVYQQGKMIYTNFSEEYPEIEEKLLKSKNTTEIEKIEEKPNVQNGNINIRDNEAEDGKTNRKENKTEKEDKIKVYIEDNKLFMEMIEDTTELITLSNISKVNDMKKEQIDYFIKLSLASSLLIAFILSITVRILTRKIKRLNKTVEEVAAGHYEARVRKIGNDEISNVGKSFNMMAKAVQDNITQIQEVAENRKRFIGNLTHEIRTPLTSIIGYASLIKNGKISDQRVIMEYCSKIHEEGTYIEKMSQKLMDLLLLENGNILIEEVNLSKELYKILQELKALFPDVRYEIQIEENVLGKIDKVLLKSLMYNLVKNAINFYEKAKVVKVELSKDKQIKVIDYGKGIPKKELEKIKEPFYTLRKDRNRKLGGMGLGLPLCIRIVEKLKGSLEIQSKENEGTKIIVKLGEEDEN